MSKRTAISAGELYVMLDREFRLRQSNQCARCYILLPYRVDQPDGDRPNWEINLPAACANGCADMLDELVRKYAALYDLAPNGGR